MARFPTDDVCLDFVLNMRWSGVFTRIKGRKSYTQLLSNGKRKQVYPLKGTIFEGSDTPLTKWFYAIFLFAHSRTGISAKELQRQIGVTYKTAWRMCDRIRSLMAQDDIKLKGVVEADETYIGGTRRSNSWMKKKTPILAAIERGGKVVAQVVTGRTEYSVEPFIKKHIQKGSTLYTDGAPVYRAIGGFIRGVVIHTRKEWANGPVNTNSVESFNGRIKGMIRGTHKWVSPQHLQKYLDYQVFMHNHRGENLFEVILSKI